MEYTGERVIIEKMNPTNTMLLEHIARYTFAKDYATGRVLDLACGSGYGTKMLAKGKRSSVSEVVGVDISEEAIVYANKTYYHPKVSYIEGNATDQTLPHLLGSFDTIVSFETLEHFEDEEVFLHNVYTCLRPGGTLIISTPFGQGRNLPTQEPFHVHQLTEEEFLHLFPQYETTFYYQKGVLIEPKKENKRYPIGIALCKKPPQAVR